MSFESIVESKIKEARANGEFDNLAGKGHPIDLSAYFDTPGELRLAYSILKNAGMTPFEIQLLQDIDGLKECLAKASENEEKKQLVRHIQYKQLQYNLLMEQQTRF